MLHNFDFFCFYLKIENGKVFWYDLKNKFIPKLPRKLTETHNKIYVITKDNDILYVGISTKNIRERIRLGIKSDGKKGYYGYKWKVLKNIKINIFSFKDLDKHKLENIEAEIVFQIKLKTGKWPSYQNEIHFNNDYDNKKIVNLIFNEHLKNYCQQKL